MPRRKLTGPAYLVVEAPTSSTFGNVHQPKLGRMHLWNIMVVMSWPIVKRFGSSFKDDKRREEWWLLRNNR